MNLAPSDFAILLAAAVAAVAGLFVGFSGSLAFLAGIAAAALTVKFGGSPLSAYIEVEWQLALAVLVLAIVAFGLVRALVRKTVHSLVAQPGDALLGATLAAFTGAMISAGAVYAANRLGIAELDSALLDAALSVVAPAS